MHILAAILADLAVLGLMLPYELAGMAVLVVILTATGAPTIKFFVRTISWRQAIIVCASATAIGFGIYFIIVNVLAVMAMEVFGGAIRHEVVGKLSFIGLVGSPILISRKVAKLGYPRSHIGLKVFLVWIAFSWILVGITLLGIKLFSP